MLAVTKKQRGLYNWIAAFQKDRGYSPSYEEIAAGLSLKSIATVAVHIYNLKAKGLVESNPKCGRSIILLPIPEEIPVLDHKK